MTADFCADREFFIRAQSAVKINRPLFTYSALGYANKKPSFRTKRRDQDATTQAQQNTHEGPRAYDSSSNGKPREKIFGRKHQASDACSRVAPRGIVTPAHNPSILTEPIQKLPRRATPLRRRGGLPTPRRNRRSGKNRSQTRPPAVAEAERGSHLPVLRLGRLNSGAP